MPRRRRNLERDVAGVELFVRLAAPNGEIGFLPIAPAIRPDSSMRFHRGVAPLPSSTPATPLYAAKKEN